MEKTYEGFLNIFKKNKKRENIGRTSLSGARSQGWTNFDLSKEPLEPLNPDEVFHELGNTPISDKVPTIQDIKDCFTDLSDLYFTIIVDEDATCISIRKKEFKYQEIKECLLFAIPYLQDEYGMRLSGGSIIFTPSSVYSKTESMRKNFNTIDEMNIFLQRNYDKNMYQLDLYIEIKGLTKK